jgi:PAS domain S-box-containing protein
MRVRSVFLQYCLAALASFIGLGVALILPEHQGSPVFVFADVAVIFAGWIGGWRAGLFAVLLTTLGADYFLIPPPLSWKIPETGSLVRLTSNVGIGLIALWIVHRMRATEVRNAELLISEREARANEAKGYANLYGRDVTGAWRAEKAMRRSEARFRTLSEVVPQLMWTADAEGKVTYVNERWCTYTGQDPEQAIGLGNYSVIHPADVPRVQERWATAIRTGTAHEDECRLRRQDGEYRWFLIRALPVPEAQGTEDRWFGTCTDIHDLKQTQRTLQQLSAIVESSGDAIIGKTLEGRITSWNRGAEQLYGYTAAEVVGQSISILVPPHQPDELAALLSRLSRGDAIEEYETSRCRKDGSLVEVSLKISPIKDAHGDITGASSIARDITARKRAEQALHEREQQLRAILDVLPVGVLMCDSSGKLIQANPAADAIWGARAPLVGPEEYQKYRGRWPGTGRNVEPGEWALARAVRTGIPVLGEEVEIETFDGKRKTILNGALPIRNATGNVAGAVAVNIDITERKLAEKALIRSEKLASVGRMAATIAHEINNPLAAAMNSLFLVSSNPELPESVRGHLELADHELERVAHITKQTLGFYREAGNPTAVELPAILDDVLRLYEPRLQNNSVRVEREYGGAIGVHAVEGEVRQVISNLIANSIDAMPQSGTLRIRTAGPVRLNGSRPMAALTIADTGTGIAAEHMKRIFEPFFTTKQSIGTGLGLWVTTELIKKHEGRINVRSCPGEGTVVTIWLPIERRSEERSRIA